MKLLLPAFASIVGALLLPNPDGPYPVAMRVHTLTDKNRVDPYAPNATDKRQILVSVFWPIDKSKECSPETVPYMPPATAQAYGLWASSNGFSNDTFSQFQLEVCGVSNVKGCRARTKSQYPLVLLSPGSGNSRLLHSAMAKSLSSYGYVVVTVDHPYDANIVEFPDGTMILGADIPETDESLEKATLVSFSRKFETQLTMLGSRARFILCHISVQRSEFPPISHERASRICGSQEDCCFWSLPWWRCCRTDHAS